MKKQITTLAFLLITIIAIAQDNYDKGFQVGYKEGYCYNEFGCVEPIPPITPIPHIGERNDSYQDGYNRGFKMGLEEKQRKKSKSSDSGNYNTDKSSKSYVSPQYKSAYIPDDLNLMDDALATMQARYDRNIAYRDKIIDWIFDLKTKSTDKAFLIAMDNYYKQLRAMDGKDFGQLGNELDIIKQNVKEEIDKCNTRAKEAPKKLWESGNENMKNKMYSLAIQDYTDLINLSPDFPYAYLNRGLSYQNQGNYSQSLADLNKFIELKSDPAAFSARGWSKYYLKDYMGALADFNKQIELEPFSPLAYYNRGSAKSELGDQNGAISDFTKSIELKPDISMVYNNRGWAKYELKKYAEALKDLNKAIELDPTNWIALDSRQETKFALNDLKGCVEDCNAVLSLNTKNSNSYFFRGRAYYKQGNKTQACKDWSKSGELGKAEAYEYISKYCNN